MSLFSRETAWNLFSVGATVAASIGLRNAFRKGWETTRNEEPPENPADSAWSDALVWASVTGLAVGIARLLARRVATEGWRQSFNEDPPPLQG